MADLTSLLNSPELFVKVLFLLAGTALGLLAALIMIMMDESARKESAKKGDDIPVLMDKIRKTVEAGPPKGRHAHKVNGKFAKRDVA